MNNIFTEKSYQHYISDRLKDNGYVMRQPKYYDRDYACDREMLFKFLNDTQADKMDALRKIYKDDLEDTIINCINNEETKRGGSRLNVLRHGIVISNIHLDLMYTKPATTFNQQLVASYQKNIFSSMEEVPASDNERIDIVTFLNGLAIMSFEVKCNFAAQSYEDAIEQYKTDRNPKTRLFWFKSGVLVNFAMDLNEVYMTTKLEKQDTFFHPFNQGKGTGINTGAGNPVYDDKFSVYYMWEDILTKDTVLDLISKFIFIETKDEINEVTGKKKRTESLIFPRYHQLDMIRKVLADLKTNHTSQNYLIEHAPGSGKTNSIVWLAYHLASLYDDNDSSIFDNVIIATDRVVVDKQLQKAVMGWEHKSGLVKVMDDSCTSADLAKAVSGNTKIIVTTLQKFPYIVNSVNNLKDKKFAVIIDEAHSSTSGKDMQAVTKSLGSGDGEYDDVQDAIVDEISRTGKQANVSMFAFTATPKPTTLQMFGRLNKNGKYEAFHLYSLKQAVEEGYVLDVLENYTTYETYYKLNKDTKDDPTLQTAKAKRQIARFARLHDTNISQRVEIIVEHFRTAVMKELDGNAKGMIVTSSRKEAVKYKLAVDKYIEKNGYDNIHSLVAFSGKVTLSGDDTEYTEPGMNGFSESRLPAKFDSNEYNLLIVANKYQQGFDQPKLCVMYVLKKLKGVNAVQTLSRLNRICPPYEKKTFVLDFVNSYADMIEAFAPYYTTTLLATSVTPDGVYDLEAKIDEYHILDCDDIEKVNDILYGGHIDIKKQQKLSACFKTAKDKLEQKHSEEEQRDFVSLLRRFVRCYEFLLQASCFEDVELHKKYNFIIYLLSYINVKHPGGGYNLEGKIKAINFAQKKKDEHVQTQAKSAPEVNLPVAESFNLTDDKEERLSRIIAEINARMGKNFDNNAAVTSMLSVTDIMMKSDKLKASAKNNTEKDFEISLYENIDDALVEGLSQNQDFFSLLLNDDEAKKEILGIFVDSIYENLRKG